MAQSVHGYLVMYEYFRPQTVYIYSSVRVIASHILHEICLLIGELVIRRTNLALIARLGTKSDLQIEQYCYLRNC